MNVNAFKNYLDIGISYDQYKQQMSADLISNADSQIREYIHLNEARMHRVEKTYIVGSKLVEFINKIEQKIYWLVLTEHWCGDAAQIIPVLRAIAILSEGKIDLKLVYRDQQEELMNNYLTNETRSIPKIIQLNSTFEVSATWGPRPSEAQQLVLTLKANPETAPTYSNALHFWYAKNKQQSIEKEIFNLLIKNNLTE